MRVLVYAHKLTVSGTTVNAIELSAALKKTHGHDVLFHATPGPMLSLLEGKGMRFFPAPAASTHPSLARMRVLRELIRTEQPDVIHAWDWPQCLDAFYVGHLSMRVPLLVSDMSMTLQRMLPKKLPTTFGTPELVKHARAAGRTHAHLMLPPVDIALNAPGVMAGDELRAKHGIGVDEQLVVTVSRLDSHMKGDSLARTVEVVGALGRDFPLRLMLVGDGDARTSLERHAAAINASLKREVIVFTGLLVDPRAAYAAADICVGMGSSALRSMAFGKPTIVVGETGFAECFSPETASAFMHTGLYGRGSSETTTPRLETAIRDLAKRPGDLGDLGKFSRDFVVDYFNLERVSGTLSGLLAQAAGHMPPVRSRAFDGLRTAALWLRERRFVPTS